VSKVRRAESVSDAEVDPLPDKPFRQPKITASVDVTPLRGRRTWALGEASVTGVSTAASLPYVLLEDTVQAATDAAAAAPQPTAAATPQRQTVGAAPGDAGSLEGLLLHLSAVVPGSSGGGSGGGSGSGSSICSGGGFRAGSHDHGGGGGANSSGGGGGANVCFCAAQPQDREVT
jgi:hypothetical protein